MCVCVCVCVCVRVCACGARARARAYLVESEVIVANTMGMAPIMIATGTDSQISVP